ncbi:MAG: AGE family epimerase/isomerase [Ignavibacteriaceae bacterium]|jgi:mannobiose 2-epimerase
MKNSLLKKNIIRLSILLIAVAFVSFKFYNEKTENHTEKVETNKDSISVELKHTLNDEFKLFYPLSIDTEYGGYYSDIDYKWELKGRQDKMIVTQARHIWANSNAALFYPDKNQFLKVAAHGVEFLKNFMWDKEFGGFYNTVDQKGMPPKANIIKQIYGNAFAIYGLAAYYKVSGDTAALNLAIKTFDWIEKHSYDPEYGGYFQFVSREGVPFPDGFRRVPPKDQNSMIHIMESFTELYSVWHNDLLKQRLNALLLLIRDTVIGNKGYMTLYFKRDWTPISYKDSSEAARRMHSELDYISFGHDVETAYLMLEASKTLGISNDTTTLRVAKQLDDFALLYGWDTVNGGIYDGGYIFKDENDVKIVKDTKEWWSHIEAANSFLMMSGLFPNDKLNYYDKFCVEWNYIKTYLLDQKYGGWYQYGIDKTPDSQFFPKASIWKCNYHTSRGLINCIRMLGSLK